MKTVLGTIRLRAVGTRWQWLPTLRKIISRADGQEVQFFTLSARPLVVVRETRVGYRARVLEGLNQAIDLAGAGVDVESVSTSSLGACDVLQLLHMLDERVGMQSNLAAAWAEWMCLPLIGGDKQMR